MTQQDILDIVGRLAAAEGVPYPLAVAICRTESGLNPWAVRHEPQYKYFVGDRMSATERMTQGTSWGLMQVMGAVAREYGHVGWLSELCWPDVGLRYGLRHLKRYYDRYKNWPDAIAAYNAGSPRRKDGKYENQAYVDKVLTYWKDQEQVPLKESEV